MVLGGVTIQRIPYCSRIFLQPPAWKDVVLSRHALRLTAAPRVCKRMPGGNAAALRFLLQSFDKSSCLVLFLDFTAGFRHVAANASGGGRAPPYFSSPTVTILWDLLPGRSGRSSRSGCCSFCSPCFFRFAACNCPILSRRTRAASAAIGFTILLWMPSLLPSAACAVWKTHVIRAATKTAGSVRIGESPS